LIAKKYSLTTLFIAASSLAGVTIPPHYTLIKI